LEGNKDCFHRVLYIFFCKRCWKRYNAIKVLRLQLKEKSEYYNGEKLLKRKEFANDEFLKEISEKIKTLSNEYYIDSRDECDEATRIYTNFYDKLDEKSIGSKNFNPDDSDDEEGYVDDEEDQVEINKEENEKIDKMIKEYQQNEQITDDVIILLKVSS
jgi:hypothetical protein